MRPERDEDEAVWPEEEPPEDEDVEVVPNPETYMEELMEFLQSQGEDDVH